MSNIRSCAQMLAKDTLAWERELDLSQGALWSAVATRKGLGRWFMPTKFEVETRPSGVLFRLTDQMGPGVDPLKLFDNDTPKSQLYRPGGLGTHWSGVVAGYHGFVDALDSYLTGRERPTDHDVMAKRYSPVLD